MNGPVQSCGRSVKKTDRLKRMKRLWQTHTAALSIRKESDMKKIAVLALLLLSACSWHAMSLRVVCITTIVGDVVAQVAGEANALSVLLSVDADPHAFEPSPQDLIAIATADILFLNGAGLERDLESLVENATGTIVALSDGLDLLVQNEHDEYSEHHHEVDPHVWFDPTYVAAWVDRIADALSEQDPERASEYRARADAYQAELSELDVWITEQVRILAPEQRRLITDHAVFGYFAARYGFEQVGTVFPGLSSLTEPSAKEIAALEDTIAALDVPAIFVGTTVNRALAERIAADTGARIVLLYTGSLSGPDGPAASYLDLIRYDVDAIVKGLSEAP